METLAYLHHALSHETFNSNTQLYCWNLKSLAHTARLLTLALGFTIFGLSNTALALQRQDSGSDVEALQSRLKEAGYFNSSTTDFYGESTEAAVRSFQQNYGLVVDGIAGSETLATLEEVVRTESPIKIERRIDSKPINSDGSIGCVDSENVLTSIFNLLDSSPNCKSVTAEPSSRTTPTSAGANGDRYSRYEPRAVDDADYQLVAVTSAFDPFTQDLIVRFKQSDSLVLLATQDTRTTDNPYDNSQDCVASLNAAIKLGEELSIDSNSYGQRVACLQELLKTVGLFSESLSLEFDRRTEEAVLKFQRLRDFSVQDGKAGVDTLEALVRSVEFAQLDP